MVTSFVMNLRCQAYEFIIKGIGITWPESRYPNPGIAVSSKTEQRYSITGMAVQNRPEYSIKKNPLSISSIICYNKHGLYQWTSRRAIFAGWRFGVLPFLDDTDSIPSNPRTSKQINMRSN